MGNTKTIDIQKAKEVLGKLDPELCIMAINHLGVNYQEVDEIKSYLREKPAMSLQVALAELHHESLNDELKVVKDRLAGFEPEILKQAAIEMSIGNEVGMCVERISCKWGCIQLMLIRNQSGWMIPFGKEQFVNPKPFDDRFSK